MNGQLNSEQQLAIDKIIEGNFTYFGLQGKGGTGKTFLLNFLPYHWKIAYTAPTHKAVSVFILNGLPEDDCYTIYALMGLQVNEANGNVTLDKNNKSKAHKYDLVVIDEASMISTRLIVFIKEMVAENPYIKVIFMGDSHQLPPVGEQLSPAFKMVDDSVTLVKQMRQSATDHPLTNLLDDLRNAIDNNTRIINFGAYNAQVVDTESGRKVGIVVTNKKDRFENWIVKSCLDDRNFNNIVTAYTNEKVDQYNKLIHDVKYNKDEYFSIGETVIVQNPIKRSAMLKTNKGHKAIIYTIGKEIKVAKISYHTKEFKVGDELELFNYAIITDAETDNIIRCLLDNSSFNKWWDVKAKAIKKPGFDFSYNWQKLYEIRDYFAQVKLSYAVTAHKSQGSTYDNVFIDVPNIQSMRELQKIINNCLYVAISRAKYTAILLVK